MSFPTCKFFKSGSGCKFGNKCRYKHSDQSPSFPTANVDRQSENGAQLRGIDNQRHNPELPVEGYFFHPVENEVPVKSCEGPSADTLLFYSGQRQLNKNEGSIKHVEVSSPAVYSTEYHKETENDIKASATVRHSQAVQQRPSRKICHYFAQNGTCCFGSNCRFVHVSRYAAPRFRQAETKRFERDAPAHGEEFDSQSGEQGHQQWEPDEVSQPIDTRQKSAGASSLQARPETPKVVQNEPRVSTSDGSRTIKGTYQGEEVSRVPSSRSHLSRPDRICQYYIQGRCYKGARKCRFLHPRQKNDGSVDTPLATESENIPYTDEPGNSVSNHQDGELNKHAADDKESETVTNREDGAKKTEDTRKSSRSAASHQPRAPYVLQGIKKYRRDEIDDVEGSRLRRNEIDQLVKRFPKSKVKVNRDCAEYFQCIIDFTPTDPDWPFDVKLFKLQVDIPSDYPLEILSVSLPVEQNLPETVRRYLEVSIEEWLEVKESELRDKGQVELVFRSFLRWLDRNIEDIVTEALRQLKRELVAKASGLEFISAKQLQKQYPGHKDEEENGESEEDEAVDTEEEDDEETSSETDDDNSSSDYDDESGEEEEEERADFEQKESSADTKNTRKTRLEKVKDMLVEPDRRGTEVSLKNLQLRENAAMMYFDKVCLIIQCERCKGPSEFTTSGGRVNVVQCGQCSQTQMCTFRPAMVHQFSPVMGYLDLDACLPFDIILQNCSMVVSCLSCSKETRPGVLVPGTFLEHWCRSCHQKLRICTDGVRFTQLEPSSTLQSLKGAVKVVVPTRKKIPKDPAIQEGKPLPNFGTCKHYKKSYRWFRFPCCGKVYPCDACHDSKEDHEMKLANRTICGFCCKEQVYSADRPCKGCDMNMTRVHTKHWEGGAGCRDKITMSRNDKAKHKNMSKTVSKHSQKVKDMQLKKKTKLRHT